MRSYDDYHRILELWELGIPKKRIAITLGIPRRTVIDCIERYGGLKGLEENKDRASRSSPAEVLRRIQDPQDIATQQAYAYVLGIYLGDGTISKSQRVYRLRIFLDAKYPKIIERCSTAIQTILPENTIGTVTYFYRDKPSHIEVYCHQKFWPEILPQHGAGEKHKRRIELADWQMQIVEKYPLEFFRGLYHSDGSRFSNIVYNRDYPRYQFSNTSPDIIRLFCDTCDRLGIHWTQKQLVNHAGNVSTDIFISKRKDVAYLDSVIGPKA